MNINFSDPQIWVAISFVLFFVFFGKLIWKQLSKFLDSKILEIENEINEAQKLHRDAKNLLEVEVKKSQDLDLIIKEIIDDSKNKSYKILLENKEKIEQQIKILEKESLEKIKVMQNKALDDIKIEIIDKASSIAENIVKDKLSKKSQHNIIQESVNTTKNIFN